MARLNRRTKVSALALAALLPPQRVRPTKANTVSISVASKARPNLTAAFDTASECTNSLTTANAHTEALMIHSTGISAVFQNGTPGAATIKNSLYIVTVTPTSRCDASNHLMSTDGLSKRIQMAFS